MWHRELKKITRFDQQLDDVVIVESIKDLTDLEQAELIVDKFASVSQEYEKLEDGDIQVPEFTKDDIPNVTEEEVELILSQMDTNVEEDVPAKTLKLFSKQLAKPVTNWINAATIQGS